VTRSHGRYESLAGAIVLGEATQTEREEFAHHAQGCALCSGLPAESEVLRAVEAAREVETWRPSVDRALLGRIHDAQKRRSRFTVGALGWAAAISIAVNVAFVTGFAGRLDGALRGAPETTAEVAAPQFVRLSPETFATIKRRSLSGAFAIAPSHQPAKHRRTHRPAGAPLRVAPAAQPPAFEPPDVLAGLDKPGNDPNSARNVAIEFAPPR
jgi:hypothetical protein